MLEEKFKAYLNIQEVGCYNMFDPRARELAQEMSGIEISRKDWSYIMANYEQLKDKYDV